MITAANLQKINEAKAKWIAELKASTSHDAKTKEFLILHVNQGVEDLIELAKSLRELYPLTHCKEWWKYRALESLENNLLSQGQAIASFLLRWHLRDSVTDIIENSYGVSFCSRKLFRPAKSHEDGHIIYVCTVKTRRETNTCFLRDGEWMVLPTPAFEKLYDDSNE